MPTPVLVIVLSLICPLTVVILRRAVLAFHPEMSISEGFVLKLASFIGSALVITFLFVRRERRAFSFGEQSSVAGLCFLWTLVLDYPQLASIIDQSAEAAGFHGAAATLGLPVAINLFLLHAAFGVVGRQFAVALLKRLELKKAPLEDA